MTSRGPASPARGQGRVASLDGLRAFALLIIIGYHFGIGWLPGGFFSLDIFYVLSGFLITGLLVKEFQRRQSIDLPAFWLRRARRLLPCLMIVLVVTALCVRWLVPADTYPGFRMSSLSALFYFSNWWQIATSSNYFVATGAPSPLTHTWSLAVEEQFYLVWPLVVLGVMHFSKSFHRGVKALLVVASVGAIASCVEMAVLYGPTANLTRLYFGTDTHAQSILIGAILACGVTLVQLRRHVSGIAPRVSSRRGQVGFAALGVAGIGIIVLLSTRVHYSSSFVFQGGFAVSALAAAMVLLSALCAGRGPVARLLGLRPMVWFGMISYGGYLWHFPVFVFVSSERTGLDGFPLGLVRFTLTVALAATSFYLVERPVMEQRFWRTLKAGVTGLAATAATVVVVVLATATSALATGVPTSHYIEHTSSRAVPTTVVVLGDSTALTLGYALSATEPRGTKVINGAIFGCGLAIASYSSSTNTMAGLPMFSGCNSDDPRDQLWPARDAATLKKAGDHALVLFLAGDWEVQDLLRNGRWINITQPSFQRYEVSQLQTLDRLTTAHQDHLDLLTMPAMANGGEFDANWRSMPVNSAKRRDIYNRLLQREAAGHPGQISLVNYGSVLSPGGVFHAFLDGVRVRTNDGVHTPSFVPGNAYAGNSTKAVAEAFYSWLSPRLWPLIIGSATNTSTTTTPVVRYSRHP